jgi:type I restriction enzyme S subunit
MSFPRYSDYRDSGLNWLGYVPEHWKLKRLGYYLGERREKVSDRDYQPLSVTKDGIVPQLETAAKTDDGDNRKRVCKGDFVINSRSDRKGSSGLSNIDGSVSLISTVLKPKESVHGAFVHHLLRSIPFQEEFYRFGKGIVADLWSTNYTAMSGITLAMPPHREQVAIATFLDRETAKIDALIAEQQRLIELLQEKRQAVISHAVTKGLNPDAPMKDSGVEWLGEVPEHWAVGKLSYYSVIGTGATPDRQRSDYWNGDIPWIKTGEVRYEDIHQAEESISELALNETSCSLLNPGTLLMALYGQGVTRGRVGMLAIQASCNQACATIAPTDSLNGRYLELYLTNAYEHIRSLGNETTQQNLNLDFVRELELLLPPTEEQQLIWQACKERAVGMDSLLGCSLDAIALLQERRSALISAAVTGQIDVRGLVPEASAA